MILLHKDTVWDSGSQEDSNGLDETKPRWVTLTSKSKAIIVTFSWDTWLFKTTIHPHLYAALPSPQCWVKQILALPVIAIYLDGGTATSVPTNVTMIVAYHSSTCWSNIVEMLSTPCLVLADVVAEVWSRLWSIKDNINMGMFDNQNFAVCGKNEAAFSQFFLNLSNEI